MMWFFRFLMHARICRNFRLRTFWDHIYVHKIWLQLHKLYFFVFLFMYQFDTYKALTIRDVYFFNCFSTLYAKTNFVVDVLKWYSIQLALILRSMFNITIVNYPLEILREYQLLFYPIVAIKGYALKYHQLIVCLNIP